MWNLMFNGEIVTGYERQQVIDNLAKTLGKSADAVSRELFKGEPVCVHQVEEEAEAVQWRRDFANAGALLIVLPADAETPGGSPYAGADPANTHVEEPTFASVFARIPGVRRRNQAYMVLGLLALIVALVLIILFKLGDVLF